MIEISARGVRSPDLCIYIGWWIRYFSLNWLKACIVGSFSLALALFYCV